MQPLKSMPELISEKPVLAFDVGGTDIKAALLGADDVELAQAVVPTPHSISNPGGAVIKAIAQLAASLEEEAGVRPAAAGLVVPGMVDEAAGVGLYSTNLGWRNYPFRARASETLGLPLGFGHDVGMAGEAEISAAGLGMEDAAVVVIGTGIAAALFDGGRRLEGAGFAGELGHLLVPASDGPCLLESVASAAAIGRRYARASGRAQRIDARQVFAAAASGDPTAQCCLDEAFDSLALGLLQVSTLLGTEVFVLSGGLAEAGEPLREPVEKRLRKLTTFQRPPRVVLGVIRSRAGRKGAALCARRALAGPFWALPGGATR